MPIYEYNCDDCGSTTEVLQMPGRADEAECEHCGGRKLHKSFSTFAARSSSPTSSTTASHSSRGCSRCASGQCATCRH